MATPLASLWGGRLLCLVVWSFEGRGRERVCGEREKGRRARAVGDAVGAGGGCRHLALPFSWFTTRVLCRPSACLASLSQRTDTRSWAPPCPALLALLVLLLRARSPRPQVRSPLPPTAGCARGRPWAWGLDPALPLALACAGPPPLQQEGPADRERERGHTHRSTTAPFVLTRVVEGKRGRATVVAASLGR